MNANYLLSVISGEISPTMRSIFRDPENSDANTLFSNALQELWLSIGNNVLSDPQTTILDYTVYNVSGTTTKRGGLLCPVNVQNATARKAMASLKRAVTEFIVRMALSDGDRRLPQRWATNTFPNGVSESFARLFGFAANSTLIGRREKNTMPFIVLPRRENVTGIVKKSVDPRVADNEEKRTQEKLSHTQAVSDEERNSGESSPAESENDENVEETGSFALACPHCTFNIGKNKFINLAHALNEARNHIQVHRYCIANRKASLLWKDNTEETRHFVEFLPYFLEEILQNVFGSKTRFERLGLSLADNLRFDVIQCRASYTATRSVTTDPSLKKSTKQKNEERQTFPETGQVKDKKKTLNRKKNILSKNASTDEDDEPETEDTAHPTNVLQGSHLPIPAGLDLDELSSIDGENGKQAQAAIIRTVSDISDEASDIEAEDSDGSNAKRGDKRQLSSPETAVHKGKKRNKQ